MGGNKYAATSWNGGISTFNMDLDDWKGVTGITDYLQGYNVDFLSPLPDGTLLANIDNSIRILSHSFTSLKSIPMTFNVTCLLPLPHFNMSTHPFALYHGESSVGLIDLSTGKYLSIDNQLDGFGLFNFSSKLQLVEVADDGSLLFAAPSDKKVRLFKIRW